MPEGSNRAWAMEIEAPMGDILESQRQQVVERHPKERGATLSDLEKCLGIMGLAGPVPSHKFLEDEEREPKSNEHAGD